MPEVPRSRHKPGKQGNTNVRDNRPFERFAFERNGVTDFGDVSYLKRDAYDAEIRSLFDGATLVRPPSTRGADGAVGWLTNLPAGSHLLPYIREEYQNYAKPLGLWAESPRATHNGTLVLRTANGATFLLADRRRSPWLPAAEGGGPPRGGREVVAAPGASCADACKEGGGRCETPGARVGERLRRAGAPLPVRGGLRPPGGKRAAGIRASGVARHPPPVPGERHRSRNARPSLRRRRGSASASSS